MARRIPFVFIAVALLVGALALAGSTTPDLSLGQVLNEALDDERRARAIYEAVVAKFGDVRPFSNIVLAEARHEKHLLPLYERYDLAVPDDPWTVEKIEVPASIAESCRQAVEAEKSNVAMYDVLLASVTQEDVRGTLELLRARSLERHLPAFERCAGGGRQGRGRGFGPGGGQGGFCGGGNGKGGGEEFCAGKECGFCSKAQ
jgi:rubrerythrin